MTTTFSHLGICVSDLERSMRFYCEGLGFSAAESHNVGEEFGPLMEIDAVALRSQFVRRDGVAIELLHFTSPGPI
ncbi:MAG TPA: VOC family protein, partial [Acidimicrobiales bacterium]